ncbi:MAG: Glycosyl transferase family 2 [Microgenomates group bacterium GW2011_GWA1_Microgenomates_45_10]|nr:MAG: Glycosyl transferase family 2 [Microgenomates group bacterium GW2011_GWA1_Microgenomates_45_10]
MAKQKNRKTITAIVPAYNEAERIGRVLSILTAYPHFEEVIVVDDGSTDGTEEIVKQYPVRYVKNTINKGKGHAMDTGVALSKGGIIFFTDADVTGLTHEIIDDILKSVVDGEVDMSIGMRNRTTFYLHYIVFFLPLLSGERAVTKNLWQMLPSHYKRRFKVETGLNFYARYYGKGFNYKVFKGLSQVIKEKKFGLIEGLRRRWLLCVNVISAQLQSQFIDIPKSAQNKRISGLVALQSLGGIFLGSLFFVAVYFGPQDFVYTVFAEALLEDPSTPFVDFLLYFVRVVSINSLLIIGVTLITINFILLLLTAKRLSYLYSGLLYKVKNKR